MEEAVRFRSGKLELAGVLHLPEGSGDDVVPCFAVLHGFGSNKDATNVRGPVQMLNEWGYGAFRFDMRGCGESDGEFGRVICLEQVDDTRAAVDYLRSRPEIDKERIALIGSSFGAAVAIYAGAVDDRVAAVISSGGWGHGERKFRHQHPGAEQWLRFTQMLEEGRRHRDRTGESLMVDRYDIVPMPQHLRTHLSPNSVVQFPAEVAQSMYNFCSEDVVGQIAPRPLLLLHSSDDSITPTEQSVSLFQRAGMPTDLHLFAETDHFMFSEDNVRVREIVKSWLDRFLPVRRDS
ncbi:alpha/beta hydrolase [Candidatus Poriferisocius sp.]|uniref:alpha/beta hydrolase n=1 Tax=Candidatus Poriferisocius sp. TaxID=3101276 RepID=UPI003B5C5434